MLDATEKNKDILIDYYFKIFELQLKTAGICDKKIFDDYKNEITKTVIKYLNKGYNRQLSDVISDTKARFSRRYNININYNMLKNDKNYQRKYYLIYYDFILRYDGITDKKIIDDALKCVENTIDSYFRGESKQYSITTFIANKLNMYFYKNNIKHGNSLLAKETEIKNSGDTKSMDKLMDLLIQKETKNIKYNGFLPENKYKKLVKVILKQKLSEYKNNNISIRSYIRWNLPGLEESLKGETFLLLTYINKFDDYTNEILDYICSKYVHIIDEFLDKRGFSPVNKIIFMSHFRNNFIVYGKTNTRYLNNDEKNIIVICNYTLKHIKKIPNSSIDINLLRSGDLDEKDCFKEKVSKLKDEISNEFIYYTFKEERDYEIDKLFNDTLNAYVNGKSLKNENGYVSTFFKQKCKAYSKKTQKDGHHFNMLLYSYTKKLIYNYLLKNNDLDEDYKKRLYFYMFNVMKTYFEKGSYGDYKKYFDEALIKYDDEFQKDIETFRKTFSL